MAEWRKAHEIFTLIESLKKSAGKFSFQWKNWKKAYDNFYSDGKIGEKATKFFTVMESFEKRASKISL